MPPYQYMWTILYHRYPGTSGASGGAEVVVATARARKLSFTPLQLAGIR